MDTPSKTVRGDFGWIEFEKNSRNVALCRYFWPATTPKAKAVLVVVHGHGNHTCFEFLKLGELGEEQTYENSFVKRANEQGLSVCGIDFQGHGYSSGLRDLRCYVDRFQDYVDDVVQLASHVSKSSDIPKFSNLPIMILGISLGGCVAANCAHQRGDLFQGAVLLAPMLSLERISKAGLNRFLRPMASLISAIFPTAQVVYLKKNEKFPDIQDAFDHDPLCYHELTRARLGAENLWATEKICKEMPDMKFPFIVFHSREDEMTDFEGSARLMELSISPDKHLEEVNDRWHFLLKEPGHEVIESKAIDWILKRAIQ
eukprot:g6753.t1